MSGGQEGSGRGEGRWEGKGEGFQFLSLPIPLSPTFRVGINFEVWLGPETEETRGRKRGVGKAGKLATGAKRISFHILRPFEGNDDPSW